MDLVRGLLVGVVGLLVLAACGDSGDGEDRKRTESIDWSQIDPPDHIDITSCSHLTNPGDSEAGPSDCSTCCSAAGFPASSYLNDGHCTCGAEPVDARATVCAEQVSATSSTACASCCETAGYNGYSWSGGESGHCTCRRPSDANVCASAFDHAVPEEACPYCCLENGFIGSGYTNVDGEKECRCVGP